MVIKYFAYFEVEEDGRLNIHAKDSKKVLNRNMLKANYTQKHEWSEIVVLLKNGANVDQVGRALDYLIAFNR